MIAHYSSQHTILLVGEGDFTFSLAVASAVGGDRLICTSLDKSTQLQVLMGDCNDTRMHT